MLIHKNRNHLTLRFQTARISTTTTDEGHTNDNYQILTQYLMQDNYQILTQYIMQDRHPVLKKMKPTVMMPET